MKRSGFSEESKRRSAEKARKRAAEKPRKPLKRTAMKKRSVPKSRGRANGQPHDIITQSKIDSARRFHDAARRQVVCARCGQAGSFDAHHVVEKAWLKANGLPEFDADNALRVCDELNENDCHGKHTRRIRVKDRLHLRNLRQENLDYAFRVMGAAAGSYLRARYRGEDERLERLEQAHE